MINLFVGHYKDPNPHRNAELVYCVKSNTNNKNFNTILLSQTVRENFSFYFDAIKKYPNNNGINIIANSDICFDDTILYTLNMLDGQVFALNRWDGTGPGAVHYNMLCSSDCWIFKGPPNNIFGDFVLGHHGSDGRVGYEIIRAGYKLYNPSLTIKTYHVHNSGVRNYSIQANCIPGPYAGAPASTLNNLIPGNLVA
jgi:hypothetical protein